MGKKNILLSSHCSMLTLLSVFPPYPCPNFLKSERLRQKIAKVASNLI